MSMPWQNGLGLGQPPVLPLVYMKDIKVKQSVSLTLRKTELLQQTELKLRRGSWHSPKVSAGAVEQGTGKKPESICPLIYLVNEDQLNKQLYSHTERVKKKSKRERNEREGRGWGQKRKYIFLCFVFCFPFLNKEEVEEAMPAWRPASRVWLN